MQLLLAIQKLRPMGGKEREFAALATLFLARGHRVTVLTGEPLSAPLLPGADVRVLAVRALSNHGRQQRFAEAVTRFRREQASFDALIAFEPIAAADYVFAAVGPLRSRDFGWREWLPRYRGRFALERATFAGDNGPGIFFLCPAQAEKYRAVYGTPPARAHVLPVAFGASQTTPRAYYASRGKVRDALVIPGDAPVLVHVAVNGLLKGLDRVIDLLPRLERAFLIAVGDTSRAMRQRAERNGVASRIRFIGPSEDVPSLIGASDLTVHPAREEAAGLVITESLLCGVPVIATAECGYAEHILRAGAGAVVASPFSQDEFADAVAAVLAPQCLADAKGAAQRYGAVLTAEGGLERVADMMLATVQSGARRRGVVS